MGAGPDTSSFPFPISFECKTIIPSCLSMSTSRQSRVFRDIVRITPPGPLRKKVSHTRYNYFFITLQQERKRKLELLLVQPFTPYLRKVTRLAVKQIWLVSIGAPHTRKSLVKGKRFIRYVWRA